MTLKKFYKDPDDRKRYTLDYTDWLDLTESVSSCVFAITPVEVGGLVVDASAIVDSKTVVFYVALGNADTDYIVEATMTSDAGQVKQDTLTYIVRSV